MFDATARFFFGFDARLFFEQSLRLFFGLATRSFNHRSLTRQFYRSKTEGFFFRTQPLLLYTPSAFGSQTRLLFCSDVRRLLVVKQLSSFFGKVAIAFLSGRQRFFVIAPVIFLLRPWSANRSCHLLS
jgi:hypothetical protein